MTSRYRVGQPVEITIRGAYHSVITGGSAGRDTHRVLVGNKLYDVTEDKIEPVNDPTTDELYTVRAKPYRGDGPLLIDQAVKTGHNRWLNLDDGAVVSDRYVTGWHVWSQPEPRETS